MKRVQQVTRLSTGLAVCLLATVATAQSRNAPQVSSKRQLAAARRMVRDLPMSRNMARTLDSALGAAQDVTITKRVLGYHIQLDRPGHRMSIDIGSRTAVNQGDLATPHNVRIFEERAVGGRTRFAIRTLQVHRDHMPDFSTARPWDNMKPQTRHSETVVRGYKRSPKFGVLSEAELNGARAGQVSKDYDGKRSRFRTGNILDSVLKNDSYPLFTGPNEYMNYRWGVRLRDVAKTL